jgi:hypothetical protein
VAWVANLEYGIAEPTGVGYALPSRQSLVSWVETRQAVVIGAAITSRAQTVASGASPGIRIAVEAGNASTVPGW